MRHKVPCAVWFLWLAAATAWLRADLVQDAVDLVSQSRYTQYLTANDFLYTHAGDARGLNDPQHDLARDNIATTLAGFGLTTALEAFTYNSTTYHNVVARMPGVGNPQDVYIVGAHFDSVGNPGADDNASGVAAVLEAARVLSQGTFDATLLFIAFDREEQGLIGSHAYVDAHLADNVLGMISLDMIAWNNPTTVDTARIYSNYAPFASNLADALTTYGGLAILPGSGIYGSDDYYFGQHGTPSALVIENYQGNPNYHRVTDSVDTPDYLDYGYATRITRGAVGYLANSAGIVLIPEPSTLVLLAFACLASRRRSRPGAAL
jgi:Zn-dependent M28 family amino/carboxypeptidase